MSLSYTVVAIFKSLELLLKAFLLNRKAFKTQNRARSFRMLISLPLPALHYHANPPQFRNVKGYIIINCLSQLIHL